MADTTWRAVPGFEGHYDVSDDGRVRSLKQGRTRVLKPAVGRWGHHSYKLSIQGATQMRTAHALVAAAFIGPRPSGLILRHLNGDAADNRVDNLTYGTHLENSHDRRNHGRDPNLNKTHCIHGHPFDAANTYYRTDRQIRGCRACRRAAQDRYEQRRK